MIPTNGNTTHYELVNNVPSCRSLSLTRLSTQWDNILERRRYYNGGEEGY